MKNLKKRISLILAVIMMATFMPVWAEENVGLELTEFIGATFEENSEKVGQDANKGYGGSFAMQINKGAGDVTFANDPTASGKGLCVSAVMPVEKSGVFSASFAPQAIRETKTKINAENLLYMSTDVYLSNAFENKISVTFNSSSNAIAQVSFEKDKKLVLAYNGGTVETDIDTDAERWYTIGVLQDKTNNKISYFIDNVPVEGGANLDGWCGEGTDFAYIRAYKNAELTSAYNICFDNIYVYNVVESSINAEVEESISLPSTVVVKNLLANPTETKSITWDEYSTNNEGVFKVFGKVADKNLFVPATITVTDPNKGNEDIEIDITEIMNAHFDLGDFYTDGTAANNGYWAGNRMMIKNWQTNNVKFAADPDTSKGGFAISSDLNPTENFSAYLKLMGDYATETKNADLLYVSTDVYFPDNFTGEFYLRFESALNADNDGTDDRLGVVIFDADGNIKVKQNADEDIEEIVISTTEKNKWYTVGVLVDKVNRKISYYLDGALVENAKDLPGWAGTGNGFEYVSGCIFSDKPDETYTMYYDNILAYSIEKYDVAEMQSIEMDKMPGKANISKTLITYDTKLNINSATATETIRWNENTFNLEAEENYFPKGNTTSSKIPVLAEVEVTVDEPATETEGLELTEFIGATFEENTENVGQDANKGYGGLSAMQINKGAGDVTFANDPTEGERGVCVSTVMPAEQSGVFSASFAPTATRDTKNLINAENLLYMSTDVYLSNAFENKVNVTFLTSGATATIAAVQFEKDNKLVIKYNGGTVTTDIDTDAERWYTIGVLQDKTNNKISYFIDNVPVEGGANLDGWCGEGTDFGMIRAYKNAELTSAYNICFDNIYVYNVVESSISAGVEESISLPSTVVVKNLLANPTETKSITWDEYSTNNEGVFKVVGKVADKNLFVPATITVTDSCKGNEDIEIDIKEIMNAHFDLDGYYTDGATAADKYWAGNRVLIKNWQNNNVKFAADPDTSRGGFAVSSDLNPTENFSAYLKLMSDYATATKNADLLYVSTDVYFPSNFTGEFALRFESALNSTKLGVVKFIADGDIKVSRNDSAGDIVIGTTQKNKWYTVGVLVDKVNSKISYYLDGALVESAKDLPGWAGTGNGFEYVSGSIAASKPTETYTMYFDNILAYSLPKYDATVLQNAGMDKMPGKANISKTLITYDGSLKVNSTTAAEIIRWNKDTFDLTTLGSYFAKGATKSSKIPVLAEVNVAVDGFVNADGVAVDSLYNYDGSLYLSIVDAVDGQKAIIAIYDNSEMLLDVEIGTVTNGMANVGFETLPENAAIAKGFLWEDLADTMIPVKKYEINSAVELYVSATAAEGGDGSLESPFATVYEARDYVSAMSSEEKADGVNLNFSKVSII